MRTVDGSAVQFFDLVKAAGLEGIVLKRKNSRYETRSKPCEPDKKGIRSWSWQKVLNYTRSDVVITGYPKMEHGWLIGVPDGNSIKPMGTMQLGITAAHRKKVWPKIANSVVGENKNFVFVEPLVFCRVKHRGFYKSGRMRLPVLDEILI